MDEDFEKINLEEEETLNRIRSYILRFGLPSFIFKEGDEDRTTHYIRSLEEIVKSDDFYTRTHYKEDITGFTEKDSLILAKSIMVLLKLSADEDYFSGEIKKCDEFIRDAGTSTQRKYSINTKKSYETQLDIVKRRIKDISHESRKIIKKTEYKKKNATEISKEWDKRMEELKNKFDKKEISEDEYNAKKRHINAFYHDVFSEKEKEDKGKRWFKTRKLKGDINKELDFYFTDTQFMRNYWKWRFGQMSDEEYEYKKSKLEDLEKKRKDFDKEIEKLKEEAKNKKWTMEKKGEKEAELIKKFGGDPRKLRKIYLRLALRSRLAKPKGRTREYVEQLIKNLIFVMAGMTASAILGSIWFLLAFLALAAYFIIPKQKNWIDDIITKVRKRYESNINDLTKQLNEAKDDSQRQAVTGLLNQVHMDMNAEIEAEVGGMRNVIIRAGSFQFGKIFMKGITFGLFVTDFVTSNMPLAKPLGLLLAFIFYFAVKEGS